MFGLLYLLLCFTTGWVICSYVFPGLSKVVEKDYEKRDIAISPYLFLFPAWYITGTLALTWPTYLIAYLFGNEQEPLLYANIIVMPIAFVVSATGIYLRLFNDKNQSNNILLNKLNNQTNNQGKNIIRNGKSNKSASKQNTYNQNTYEQNTYNQNTFYIRSNLICKDTKVICYEIILLLAITVLGFILMWTTFFVKDNSLHIGVTVFSDFSPHIGMIRSFSFGNNFPTAYSHYAGEDIKYHFMFQFLVGNLEYLGMRIDYAFNIPSLITFITAFLMIYILAVKIAGKISVGFLACLFFAFRSAKTLFTYLANLPEGTNLLKALWDNTEFISDTPFEYWGLWNLNVYCNQRHLAFGLTVFFFIIILMTPHLYEMFDRLRQLNHVNNLKNENIADNINHSWDKNIRNQFIQIFFTKDAWVSENIGRAIAIGIILGSMSFFHGAAVIGCLAVLFVMAILSYRRLEFLVVAVITLLLSFLQTSFFINGSAVATKFYFGFIAENKTLLGVASYLERLLGVLPIVLLLAFCIEKGVRRYQLFAYTAPLILAFTLSLTVDVTVNHKYIMMSCILLGIFAAIFIMRLFERKDFFLRLFGIVLIIMLTATGIYDFITVIRRNPPETAIVLDMDSNLTQWINENSNSKDIFLTHDYTINQVVFGGAMLYEGYAYYPMTAGYDTDKRYKLARLMYELESPKALDDLVKENKIRFIIVDVSNRQAEEYQVNEDNIKATYECVYSEGEGEWMISIYDTEKPIYN